MYERDSYHDDDNYYRSEKYRNEYGDDRYDDDYDRRDREYDHRDRDYDDRDYDDQDRDYYDRDRDYDRGQDYPDDRDRDYDDDHDDYDRNSRGYARNGRDRFVQQFYGLNIYIWHSMLVLGIGFPLLHNVPMFGLRAEVEVVPVTPPCPGHFKNISSWSRTVYLIRQA